MGGADPDEDQLEHTYAREEQTQIENGWLMTRCSIPLEHISAPPRVVFTPLLQHFGAGASGRTVRGRARHRRHLHPLHGALWPPAGWLIHSPRTLHLPTERRGTGVERMGVSAVVQRVDQDVSGEPTL